MLNQRPWLDFYPEGVPADIDASQYQSLVDLLEESFAQHADKTAYSYMGQDFTFAEVERYSRDMAAFFQSLGLQKGDRVAIMMPNVVQYPVVVAGVLRAGLVLVNVNPLYTARELEHQLRDSEAVAIVILENFAHTLQACMTKTNVQHVVLASMGDMLGPIKGRAVNFVVRQIRKLVEPFELAGAINFNDALARGRKLQWCRESLQPEAMAVLQYTGGTTGVSKGAVLSHRNIIANVLQSEAWNAPALKTIPTDEQPTSVCALPLYHIFAFTVNMMLGMRTGTKNILLPNPRDLEAVLDELAKHRFHTFPAVNTLFNGLANHPDFDSVDWSSLRLCVGGGMAVQRAVAQLWLEKTGCPICEGYGLSETSPSVSCNPVTGKEYTGTIGLPLPSTWVKCVDLDGKAVAVGEPGEIAIKGPQVMQAYWRREEESLRSMTVDGYFLTGDIGIMDERGYIRIVDRKKDMILVSGFNVYPNEVEDVMSGLDGVLECAAIGVADPHSGEAVKLFIVRKNAALNEEMVRDFSRRNLTGYKQPKWIEFREELPKTPVGKILRRQLRDA